MKIRRFRLRGAPRFPVVFEPPPADVIAANEGGRMNNESMIRKWLAWGLPTAQIERLAVAHCGADAADARSMVLLTRIAMFNEGRRSEGSECHAEF